MSPTTGAAGGPPLSDLDLGRTKTSTSRSSRNSDTVAMRRRPPRSGAAASGCSSSRTPCTTGARRSALRSSCSSSSSRAFGPCVAPHSPSEFVAAPFATAVRHALARQRHTSAATCSAGCSTAAARCSSSPSSPPPSASSSACRSASSRATPAAAIDDVIMRLLDVLLAFPQIVFALLLVSVLGPRLWLIVLTVGLVARAAHRPRGARRHAGGQGARLRARRPRRSACRALQDPLRRDPAEHHEPAAGRVRPAPHLLHRPHRRPVASSASACSRRPPTGAS